MTSRVTLAVTVSLTSCFSLSAADGDHVRTSLYRSGAAQQELISQGSNVRGEMELALREMERNGLLETDRDQLGTLLENLSVVTDERMAAVLASLKAAATGSAPGDIKAGTVAGYKGMQSVSETLRDLAAGVAILKKVEAFPGRLKALILRQQANQRAYVGRAAAPSLAATILPEQIGISETFATLIAEVTVLVGDRKNTATQPLGQALNEALRLRLPEAAAELAASTNLDDPTFSGRQGRLVSGFTAMLAAFETHLSVVDQAARLAQELGDLAASQRALAGGSESGEAAVAQQQALMDRTALASRALARFDAEKQAGMNNALREMAESRAHLAEAKSGENTSAEAAAEALERIAQAVNEQAQEIADGMSPSEAVAGMKELFNETAQLKADVDRGQTPASELAGRAAELQRSSQAVAPEAAADMGAAQQQMAQDRAAASESLAQALTNLGQQIRDVGQLADAAAQLENAGEQLAQAESALEQASGGSQSAAAQQESLAAAGGALAAAASAMGGAASEAAEAAKGAQAGAALASQESKAGNSEGAAQSAGAALASARSARAALEKAQGELADRIGQKIAMAPQAGTDDSNRKGGVWDGKMSESQTPFVNTGDELSHVAAAHSLVVVPDSSPAARDAATVLANERPPTAFQSETQQYLRNLATGR
jgi:hypothetical protein